ASVINVLDPDVIVLGGGLSNLSRLYGAVPRAWARYVFSDRVDTRLLAPRHGDSSGVRGAAWPWPPDTDPRSACGRPGRRGALPCAAGLSSCECSSSPSPSSRLSSGARGRRGGHARRSGCP